MSKALTSFALVAVFTAALMALSLAMARHGYSFGAVGVHRLDSIADVGTFLPLAACYFFSALLMMILPIGAAGLVLANAADVIFWCVVVLFATITGCLAARWAFGQSSALWALWNWRFLLVAAIAGCHLAINELRRNILLRSLFVAIFAAMTAACLFWSFLI